MTQETITDADRYPALTEAGRQMLRFMREHPHAPQFRNESGHRLTPAEVDEVRAYHAQVLAARVGWPAGTQPTWIEGFVAHCIAEVPHYRRYGHPPTNFTDLPTIHRGDLGRDIARFVPDSVPVERLINYRTSGTTGHPLLLASHPLVAARYLAYHRRALRRFGIELRHGRGQVGVVLVGFQRRCFTYVSVTPVMDESGLAKLNLHPDDWHDPHDRARYLDALNAEVLTGDPLSLAELLTLPLQSRPRALLSTSMTLHPGLRRRLEARFACPVLDLYSMNEAGAIAVYDESSGGHVLLQERLFVEILDESGQPVAPGGRGEITLTGGYNFCLPLLRYRTGDYASLAFTDTAAAEPMLVGLEGRPPVRFRTLTGQWLNNIEITQALQDQALSQFTLHQNRDGSLRFRCCDSWVFESIVKSRLETLFGDGQAVRFERVPRFEGKVVQYTTELTDDAA